MTRNDVFTNIRKKTHKKEKEIAWYKGDQAKNEAITETFSDFLDGLNMIAKNSFNSMPGNTFRRFFGTISKVRERQRKPPIPPNPVRLINSQKKPAIRDARSRESSRMRPNSINSRKTATMTATGIRLRL